MAPLPKCPKCSFTLPSSKLAKCPFCKAALPKLAAPAPAPSPPPPPRVEKKPEPPPPPDPAPDEVRIDGPKPPSAIIKAVKKELARELFGTSDVTELDRLGDGVDDPQG